MNVLEKLSTGTLRDVARDYVAEIDRLADEVTYLRAELEKVTAERDAALVHIDKLTEGRQEELKHAENIAIIAERRRCANIARDHLTTVVGNSVAAVIMEEPK